MNRVLMQAARSIGGFVAGYVILIVLSVAAYLIRSFSGLFDLTVPEAAAIDIRVLVLVNFIVIGSTAYVVARIAGAMGTLHALFWSVPVVISVLAPDHHRPYIGLSGMALSALSVGLGALAGGFLGDVRIYGREKL